MNFLFKLKHEFGHNMQRPEWTFDGATEVTCNIFSLHADASFETRSIIHHPWIQNSRKLFGPFFASNPNYESWKSINLKSVFFNH